MQMNSNTQTFEQYLDALKLNGVTVVAEVGELVEEFEVRTLTDKGVLAVG